MIDRRYVVLFQSLNEEQETKIITSLTDFLLFFIKHQTYFKKFNISTDLDFLNFWKTKVAKTNEIEEMSNSIEVVADCMNYITKYREIIWKYRKDYVEDVKFKYSKCTSNQLERIARLFHENNENEKVIEIKEYLDSYNFKLDNLTWDYAEKIIKSIST